LFISVKISAMEKQTKNNDALLLRLPAELKAELQRQANINGRRITAEINTRLRASLDQNVASSPVLAAAELSLRLPKRYTDPHAATIVHAKCNGPDYALTDIDQAMLDVFHALPVEKQLALLSLFR
jgi:hypothetical protein